MPVESNFLTRPFRTKNELQIIAKKWLKTIFNMEFKTPSTIFIDGATNVEDVSTKNNIDLNNISDEQNQISSTSTQQIVQQLNNIAKQFAVQSPYRLVQIADYEDDNDFDPNVYKRFGDNFGMYNQLYNNSLDNFVQVTSQLSSLANQIKELQKINLSLINDKKIEAQNIAANLNLNLNNTDTTRLLQDLKNDFLNFYREHIQIIKLFNNSTLSALTNVDNRLLDIKNSKQDPNGESSRLNELQLADIISEKFVENTQKLLGEYDNKEFVSRLGTVLDDKINMLKSVELKPVVASNRLDVSLADESVLKIAQLLATTNVNVSTSPTNVGLTHQSINDLAGALEDKLKTHLSMISTQQMLVLDQKQQESMNNMMRFLNDTRKEDYLNMSLNYNTLNSENVRRMKLLGDEQKSAFIESFANIIDQNRNLVQIVHSLADKVEKITKNTPNEIVSREVVTSGGQVSKQVVPATDTNGFAIARRTIDPNMVENDGRKLTTKNNSPNLGESTQQEAMQITTETREFVKDGSASAVAPVVPVSSTNPEGFLGTPMEIDLRQSKAIPVEQIKDICTSIQNSFSEQLDKYGMFMSAENKLLVASFRDQIVQVVDENERQFFDKFEKYLVSTRLEYVAVVQNIWKEMTSTMTTTYTQLGAAMGVEEMKQMFHVNPQTGRAQIMEEFSNILQSVMTKATATIQQDTLKPLIDILQDDISKNQMLLQTKTLQSINASSDLVAEKLQTISDSVEYLVNNSQVVEGLETISNQVAKLIDTTLEAQTVTRDQVELLETISSNVSEINNKIDEIKQINPNIVPVVNLQPSLDGDSPSKPEIIADEAEQAVQENSEAIADTQTEGANAEETLQDDEGKNVLFSSSAFFLANQETSVEKMTSGEDDNVKSTKPKMIEPSYGTKKIILSDEKSIDDALRSRRISRNSLLRESKRKTSQDVRRNLLDQERDQLERLEELARKQNLVSDIELEKSADQLLEDRLTGQLSAQAQLAYKQAQENKKLIDRVQKNEESKILSSISSLQTVEQQEQSVPQQQSILNALEEEEPTEMVGSGEEKCAGCGEKNIKNLYVHDEDSNDISCSDCLQRNNNMTRKRNLVHDDMSNVVPIKKHKKYQGYIDEYKSALEREREKKKAMRTSAFAQFDSSARPFMKNFNWFYRYADGYVNSFPADDALKRLAYMLGVYEHAPYKFNENLKANFNSLAIKLLEKLNVQDSGDKPQLHNFNTYEEIYSQLKQNPSLLYYFIF